MISISVRCMMFGFGDDKNPYTESVDLLEDMVVEYISEMVSMVDSLKFPTINACQGAQWLSGRVHDSRPRGCGFESHWGH